LVCQPTWFRHPVPGLRSCANSNPELRSGLYSGVPSALRSMSEAPPNKPQEQGGIGISASRRCRHLAGQRRK